MKNQTTREERNERILAIGEFQKAINKVIREENIPCLYDNFENDYNICGYHVAQLSQKAFKGELEFNKHQTAEAN